jgi:hypothetical protein
MSFPQATRGGRTHGLPRVRGDGDRLALLRRDGYGLSRFQGAGELAAGGVFARVLDCRTSPPQIAPQVVGGHAAPETSK